MAYIFARTERKLERYCKIKDNKLSFWADEFVNWGELMSSRVVGLSLVYKPVSWLVLHSSQFTGVLKVKTTSLCFLCMPTKWSKTTTRRMPQYKAPCVGTTECLCWHIFTFSSLCAAACADTTECLCWHCKPLCAGTTRSLKCNYKPLCTDGLQGEWRANEILISILFYDIGELDLA